MEKNKDKKVQENLEKINASLKSHLANLKEEDINNIDREEQLIAKVMEDSGRSEEEVREALDYIRYEYHNNSQYFKE